MLIVANIIISYIGIAIGLSLIGSMLWFLGEEIFYNIMLIAVGKLLCMPLIILIPFVIIGMGIMVIVETIRAW